jgi:DNA polymerase-3 subunit alpha (Gram-positive type)
MNGQMTEPKNFSEVFPGLKTSEKLKTVVSGMQVDCVKMNRKRDQLRVYVSDDTCVERKAIIELEKSIKRQLFSDVPIRVSVIEHFHLSSLYTAETLMDVYGKSIEYELENHSHVLASLFRGAEFSYPEPDVMVISLEDSMIARDMEKELCSAVDSILNERCGLRVKVEIEYRTGDPESFLRKSEEQMRSSAAQVVRDTPLAFRKGFRENGGAGDGEEASAGPADERDGSSGTPGNAASGTTRGEAGAESGKESSLRKAPSASLRKGRGGIYSRGGRDARRSMLSVSPDDPDQLYGRKFEGDSIPICDLDEFSGSVIIRGEIIQTDSRPLRNERGLVILTVTDYTDTIRVKCFVAESEIGEMESRLKTGTCVRVMGKAVVDSFEHELAILSVSGIRRTAPFREKRHDNYPEKRVELHCHTKMSDMDGITDAEKLVRRAYEWGHPAIAITDHGVVQSFPEANHAMEAIDGAWRKQYASEHPGVTKEELKKLSAPFKVIYGMEAYLVDDMKEIARNSRGQSLGDTCVVFDLETTGLSNITCKIIEIGAVKVEHGKITDRYSTFVNPKVPIPMNIEKLTDITDRDVENAPDIDQVLPEFLEFCGDAVMVAHNADFDMGFIGRECARQGFQRDFTVVDTVAMARVLLPGLSKFKLDNVAKAAGVELGHHHRAVDDAECTAGIFLRFSEMLADRDISDLDGLNRLGSLDKAAKRKLPSHHAIILATGETGRVNLYRLVSESHLNYVYRLKAKLPKSVVMQHREGLLLGSACVQGELFDAILRGADDSEIARIVSFYDYLEIQPTGNNAFLIGDDAYGQIRTEEDLRDLNRRIVQLGEQFKKPVVATCDVHFMDPEDEVYRRIIMSGKKFRDADDQAPLYLHTTEEMLDEFSYLGAKKAHEVVIDNPQKIADSIQKISPIREGKFPPVIEDSDKTLREICYRRAHEIYGEELPPIVADRLERELTSIISNGYAVMYIIAQKLVWKSNEDGYLVGSRGSVGSSFVATMAGITEVNPLPPHYLCESCKYVDFDSDEVQSYKAMGKAGCDMPDAVCPNCGKPLKKMGFNIPFETFLGFKGNKEPDIDLNFSGEYQSKAHKYTEVIFGAGQTFRAGTIGTLADKTAYGYVKNYYEEHGQSKRTCEIDRIVQGCVGIRRTTGQHPGGIIVLPFGEDINSFTPVQHPADDMNSDIITTHFDYHSIDSNLLKLDILGHDDPTMIRMLEDLTGTDATKVPLDEPKVMSLFKSTEALGIRPEDIGGCPLGCLGVPEFGTDFVIQMLLDTKPSCFSDLIRISGLSHGTDVWLGNAQTLIEEGKATISTAICTRDDIMVYLIGKGLESEESFTIMENVRKGKVAKGKAKDWPKWSQDMRDHGVPEWYIRSCEKIKYMFPKAHAVAYVMMAYRIAWYKIYYPLAYYAAYFSIRASAFSYEKMCMGKGRLEEHIREIQGKENPTAQEQDMLKDMAIVREMYARGFEFMPIDLYRAQAHRFQIIDGKLMPSLDSIEGLGEKAADSIVLATRSGEFLSKDDFRKRAKVGKTVSDTLDRLGILGDLPETNQISLFDFGKTEEVTFSQEGSH